MSDSFHDFLSATIGEYIQCARACFRSRLDEWNIDIFDKEVNEVVGGLLALLHLMRQPQAMEDQP